MMLIDQTDKAYRSNVVRDLGGIQFMSIVTTQLKLITNVRVVEYQRVEESI